MNTYYTTMSCRLHAFQLAAISFTLFAQAVDLLCCSGNVIFPHMYIHVHTCTHIAEYCTLIQWLPWYNYHTHLHSPVSLLRPCCRTVQTEMTIKYNESCCYAIRQPDTLQWERGRHRQIAATQVSQSVNAASASHSASQNWAVDWLLLSSWFNEPLVTSSSLQQNFLEWSLVRGHGKIGVVGGEMQCLIQIENPVSM